MLTAESEGGQLKCHSYWKGTDFGSIKLRVLSEKKVSLDIDRRRSPPSADAATNNDCSASFAQPSFSDSCSPEGARRRANTTTTAFNSGAQTSNQFNFNPQAAGTAETPYVVIRKFALSHAAHPFLPIREITQLHYPSWPDFGAPAQPSHLLALVELANVMQRAMIPMDVPGAFASTSHSQLRNGPDQGSAAGCTRPGGEGVPLSWSDGPESNQDARPMLVHCSAGCGRTGAFCTVDSVIDMLKRQKQHMIAQSTRDNSSQAQGSARQSDGLNVAQGLALHRDADGDISMDGAMDGAKAEHDHGVDRSEDNPGIDTSWLDDDNIDLIAQTVEDFRGQRLSMVQSLRQFVLCYETVLEWISRVRQSDSGVLDTRGRGRSGSLTF